MGVRSRGVDERGLGWGIGWMVHFWYCFVWLDVFCCWCVVVEGRGKGS